MFLLRIHVAFDCGSGVIIKYVAMGVAYSRMTKIFLTHLHADHMSDLMFIYCFGPSVDRMTDQHVWGPTGPTSNESVTAACQFIRDASRWRSRSTRTTCSRSASGSSSRSFPSSSIRTRRRGVKIQLRQRKL